MKTILGELLVGNCENILRLNNLVATHSSYLILYKNKAMRQSGLLSDDNKDVSEACVTRSLVRDWFSVSIQTSFPNVTLIWV